MTLDSSILTHVFRYDHFYPLDELYLLLFASTLIRFAHIFIIRVDRLRNWRLGTFLGTRFTGTGKKVSAPCLHYHSLCIRTFFGWTLAASSTFFAFGT
jgi:hypothetical protein